MIVHVALAPGLRCHFAPGMPHSAVRSPNLSSTRLVMSIGSIALCLGLWIRAKTVGQDERGNAERRALFVGLWPPMFWLIGDSLEKDE